MRSIVAHASNSLTKAATTPRVPQALLEVEKLSVEFGTEQRPLRAVDEVDFSVEAGQTLGIVGESGSGKSVTALAVMGLIETPGRVRGGSIRFDGRALEGLTRRQRRQLVGKDMAMIFQEPGTSLNPCFTVGYQIEEVLRTHSRANRAQRRARAIELLEQVGIGDAPSRLDAFPHQLSGGMNQRIMIAMAIACNPRLLIADEPTTALDVTIQAQILDLLRRLQRERGMALILITHDLAVVAEMAARAQVMYAGRVVEEAAVDTLFSAPRHPYTEGLLRSLPGESATGARLRSIPGVVPSLAELPTGCHLRPRCEYARQRCGEQVPALTGQDGRTVRCFYPLGEQP